MNTEAPTQAFSNMNIGRNGEGQYQTPSWSNSANAGSGRAADNKPDRLIVGVDFGTTYSGVAAVYSATPDDIEVIKTWPGGNGITSDKVPTEISYPQSTPSTPTSSRSTNSNPSLRQSTSNSPLPRLSGSPASNSAPCKWGFQFKPEEPRIRCIKLFLDRSQALPSFISPLETATLLRAADKNVLDAVTDYLSALYNHTMDTLTRRYGESFMKATPVEWVLTCPAVWSDAAKNATKRAAERAGMVSLDGKGTRLISEPEAAAVYTLKAIQPNHLRVGDNFVVCDAGGGTVDLISYEITQLQPLLVQESAVGSGALCGSAFLNYAFEDHCKRRLTPAVWDTMRPRTKTMAMKFWDEYVKRNYKGDDEDAEAELPVPFPGLPDNEEAGLDGGFLNLTGTDVKNIFEPVISEVIKLCEDQVNGIRIKGGRVAGIVLVGGFGQSNYLYNRLKAYFNNVDPPPYTERPTSQGPTMIEVMQPLYAWTAVVRGAVLRGLEGSMVVSRRTRWHYGTSYATVYDEIKHPIADRYWSPLWERWMGEPVSERKAISFHYTRNFRPGQSLVVEDDLIACETEEAPDSMKKGLVNVCTLTTDLSAVPKTLFTRLTTSKGVEFDNLDFTLDMIVDSASLIFELKVDGVAYGSVKAKFH
ncbi:hypothetical protein RUND412_010786 [Rhizina undulata]